MSAQKVLLVAPDAKISAEISSALRSEAADLLLDAVPRLASTLPRIAAGEYSGVVCVVDAPEDLGVLVRIRRVKPDVAVVALTDGASATLLQLARQMGASAVVDRAADPPGTGLQLVAALRNQTARMGRSIESTRRNATEIRALSERSRELVARAMAILASCNDRPFVVLHVDDDSYEEFALRRLLIRAGLPSFVRSFRCPADAIRYLEGEGEFADRVQHPLPSLVISDLRMGVGMDGLDFLDWIRRRPEFEALGFILVTSSDAEKDVRRAAEAGANLYVVKSIRMDNVIDILRAAYATWLEMTPENRAPQG